MSSPDELITALRVTAPENIASVLPHDLGSAAVHVFDLSARNPELAVRDLSNADSFTAYIFGVMEGRGVSVGVGRYDEDRVIYRHSPLFGDEAEPRSIHLGIDLFVAPGTEVHAPFDGTVHSFANNEGVGNYGPTIVLEHRLAGIRFFTLYGHLSTASTARLRVAQQVDAGARIGWIGEARENGGWPPHLHFQIIADIGGWRGDFPGVARPSERKDLLALCPDPNLILGIPDVARRTRSAKRLEQKPGVR